MLINLTPHEIVILVGDEERHILPFGEIARCTVSSRQVRAVDGIAVYANIFGAVEGLPDPQEGTTFIVSFPVLQALAGKRSDLVGPDTSPAGNPVRNEAGQIVAVRRFQVL